MDDREGEVASAEPEQKDTRQVRQPWSRREFLGLSAAATAGLITPGALRLSSGGSVAAAAPFTGTNALRLAMHVHASWSEGSASWEAQFAQAAANALDVLYMTDHDFRATARNFIGSLAEAAWVRSNTGSTAQQAATTSGGRFRLLAESSSTTAPASVTLALQPKPLEWNRVRTSIAGQALDHSLTSATLSGGATYEIGLDLSYHPPRGRRPAGNYRLVYRYGAFTAARFKENSGFTGVVTAPTPPPGSVQHLTPATDVAALWPKMLAMDNSMYNVWFTVNSPHRGAVADVSVAGVKFLRTQNTPTSVTANQASLISTYQPRFPNLTVKPSIEIGEPLPHMNPFSMPQYFPDYSTLPTDPDLLFEAIVADVHAKGGLISLNHPFGFNTGPLLSATDRATKRHQVWQQLRGVHDYGVDVLEVGYLLRGQVDAPTHIALFDTFARNGTFLTANGTNDDHGGQNWKGLQNGFFTGLWAASRSDDDIRTALAGGRAFTAHLGKWAGGEIDLLVDGSVPMGAVSVSSKATRSLAIYAANLPTGGGVQLVSGPVDYAGAQDPGTSVVRTWAPSAFSSGVATVSVDTSTSRFFRVQVLSSDGTLVGCGNPVWLLRTTPPGGIPTARQ